MRIEATLPDSRGNAAVKLAEELGLSRSQLVDEALTLFVKAIMEVRRGRRLVTIDPLHGHPACELGSPTLTALEWAARPERLEVSAAEVAKIVELNNEPPGPTEALRGAARLHREEVARRASSAHTSDR